MIRAKSIHEALAYVHYWSARERGPEQRGIAEAAKEAIRISALSEKEQDILLNAILVKREEL